MNLEVLFEDNHLLVVYKPAGVLSQADITGDIDMLTLGKQYIKHRYNKPGDVYLGLVHRLDRMTSGVMVFAKTSKAAMRLSQDIANHNFFKEYVCVCEGSIENFDETTLINNLEKDEKLNKSFVRSKKCTIKNYIILARHTVCNLWHAQIHIR